MIIKDSVKNCSTNKEQQLVHLCLFLFEHAKSSITSLAVRHSIPLVLLILRNGALAVCALEAQFVVRLAMEGEKLRRIHRLTALHALLSRHVAHALQRLRVLAHHTVLAFVLFDCGVALRVVLRLIRARTVQLLVALRALRFDSVVVVVTSADDRTAVHALEAQLVVHLSQSSQTLREQNSLAASGADRIIHIGVDLLLLNLSISIVCDPASNEKGPSNSSTFAE